MQKSSKSAELHVAEIKILSFSVGVARIDRIMNATIRGTANVRSLRDKFREAS